MPHCPVPDLWRAASIALNWLVALAVMAVVGACLGWWLS